MALTERDKALLLGAIGDPASTQNIIDLLNQAGTGNMSGPISSTDKALPRFNGLTGAIVQNSGVILSDANGLTGISTLAMAGALSGVTSLAMAGALSGVTSLGMSGALTGSTNISTKAVFVTDSKPAFDQVNVTVLNTSITGTSNLTVQADTGAATFQANQSGFGLSTGDLGPNQGTLYSQAGLLNGLWLASLDTGGTSKITFNVGGTADANRILRLKAAVIEPLKNITPVVDNSIVLGTSSFGFKETYLRTGATIGTGAVSHDANNILVVQGSLAGSNVVSFVKNADSTGWATQTLSGDTSILASQMQGTAAGFPGTMIEADSAQMYTTGTNGMGLFSLGGGAGSKIFFSIGGVVAANNALELTSTNVNVSKLALKMNSSATAASTSIIFNGINDGSIFLGGGAGIGNSNAAIQLFGSTEASHAKETRFFNNSILAGIIDANALWSIGQSGETGSQAINTGVATPAADVLTFTNGPTGTAGDPGIYMKLNINGTVYAFPGFAV